MENKFLKKYFGGIGIIAPKDCKVVSKGSAIFGGVEIKE